MSAPDIIIAEVGKFYMVPCMFVPKELRAWGMDEWVPIFGTKHGDPDLGVADPHYHIDWRFVSEKAIKCATFGQIRSPLGRVLSNDCSRTEHKITGKPVLKRRLCKRTMPEFPDLQGSASIKKFAAMEADQINRCQRLKNGHICPHRGIDLRPFEKEDGTAICPGHGLRWNLKTGELVPRYTIEVKA